MIYNSHGEALKFMRECESEMDFNSFAQALRLAKLLEEAFTQGKVASGHLGSSASHGCGGGFTSTKDQSWTSMQNHKSS
jgi:hypothetical protein